MPRITQRDIARLAGVSQATVSLVLNNRTDATTRVAPETRQRVLDVIRETGYVADPVARRMAARHNRILGVFTYEPVFPSTSADFYYPFLRRHRGVRRAARLRPAAVHQRPGHRRAAQGLPREQPAAARRRLPPARPATYARDELARLIGEDYPFVAVGRRDDAGGPVPYVGADYAARHPALVERARQLGHRRARLRRGGGGRRVRRRPGARVPRPAAQGQRPARADSRPVRGECLDALLAAEVTTAVVEEPRRRRRADQPAARERGLDVPGDLSVVVPRRTRPASADIDIDVHRLPHPAPGDGLAGRGTARPPCWTTSPSTTLQRLLPCQLVDGADPRRHRERTALDRDTQADVLVVGGGLGGVAAALAAARAGRSVVLTEEYDWLGGQLTSQAVPPDEHSWVEQFGVTRQLPRPARRHPRLLPRPLPAHRRARGSPRPQPRRRAGSAGSATNRGSRSRSSRRCSRRTAAAGGSPCSSRTGRSPPTPTATG